METVGFGSTLIVTWSDEDGHVPLEIVHWKTFAPTVRPVTAEVAEFGLMIVPVPEISVHTPVPTAGTFPANNEEDEQIV